MQKKLYLCRKFEREILRAQWEERHAAFQKVAKKKGDYTYPRLWDYIRHELNLAKVAAEK